MLKTVKVAKFKYFRTKLQAYIAHRKRIINHCTLFHISESNYQIKKMVIVTPHKFDNNYVLSTSIIAIDDVRACEVSASDFDYY